MKEWNEGNWGEGHEITPGNHSNSHTLNIFGYRAN